MPSLSSTTHPLLRLRPRSPSSLIASPSPPVAAKNLKMSSLHDNVRNLRLDGTVLHASVPHTKTSSAIEHLSSTIDLNLYIGNLNGVLTWGEPANFFASSVRNTIKLDGTRLSIELLTGPDRKTRVKSSIDLAERIRHRAGKLEFVPMNEAPLGASIIASRPGPTPLKSAASIGSLSGAAAAASLSSASVASAASLSSASIEQSQSLSQSTVQQSSTTTHSEQKFSSSSSSSSSLKVGSYIQSFSFASSIEGELLLSITKEGVILTAKCKLFDFRNTYHESSINLSTFIGNSNGRLIWGPGGFHINAKNIHLEEGHWLVATLPTVSETFVEARIDLNIGLRNDHGHIVYALAYARADISEYISTMPWVKFQVTAQPDFSGILSSAIAKEAMTTIAESTVDSVVSSMSHIINRTIQEAVQEVKVQASRQMALVMETMLQSTLAQYQHVNLMPSATEITTMKLFSQLMAGQHGGILGGVGAGAGAAGWAFGQGQVHGHGHSYGGAVQHGHSGGFITSNGVATAGHAASHGEISAAHAQGQLSRTDSTFSAASSAATLSRSESYSSSTSASSQHSASTATAVEAVAAGTRSDSRATLRT